MSIPADALTAGGAIIFIAIMAFIAIISFRIPSPRELKDKDRQISYLQDALAKSEEQKAALMVTVQNFINKFDELLDPPSERIETNSWRQRVRRSK